MTLIEEGIVIMPFLIPKIMFSKLSIVGQAYGFTKLAGKVISELFTNQATFFCT
jgi:hypothetical protein